MFIVIVIIAIFGVIVLSLRTLGWYLKHVKAQRVQMEKSYDQLNRGIESLRAVLTQLQAVTKEEVDKWVALDLQVNAFNRYFYEDINHFILPREFLGYLSRFEGLHAEVVTDSARRAHNESVYLQIRYRLDVVSDYLNELHRAKAIFEERTAAIEAQETAIVTMYASFEWYAAKARTILATLDEAGFDAAEVAEMRTAIDVLVRNAEFDLMNRRGMSTEYRLNLAKMHRLNVQALAVRWRKMAHAVRGINTIGYQQRIQAYQVAAKELLETVYSLAPQYSPSIWQHIEAEAVKCDAKAYEQRRMLATLRTTGVTTGTAYDDQCSQKRVLLRLVSMSWNQLRALRHTIARMAELKANLPATIEVLTQEMLGFRMLVQAQAKRIDDVDFINRVERAAAFARDMREHVQHATPDWEQLESNQQQLANTLGGLRSELERMLKRFLPAVIG